MCKKYRGLLIALSMAAAVILSACAASGDTYASAAPQEENFNMLVTAFASDMAESEVVIRGETTTPFIPQEEAAAMAGESGDEAPGEAPGPDGLSDEEAGGVPEMASVSAGARKIVKTVDMEMESTDYDACVADIQSAIEAAGGYIEYANMSGGLSPFPDGKGEPGRNPSAREGGQRYLHYRIRVPQERLEEFTREVESYGKLLSKQEDAEDITLRYVDVESRKKALLLEQEQLMEMLGRAEDVESIIRLQERLAEVRYELDSRESQLRVMENQVSYSTVSLSLNEVVDYSRLPVYNPTVGQRVSSGFQQTLQDIRVYWTNQFVWVAVNSVYIAAVLLVAGALLVVARRYIKKHRKFAQAEKAAQADGGPEDEGQGEQDGKKKRPLIKRGLSAWYRGLLAPPFHRLDRWAAGMTLLHLALAFLPNLIEAVSYWYVPWPVVYLICLPIASAAMLMHFASYVTIPATTVALVRRLRLWNRLEEKPDALFGKAANRLLIALQLAAAALALINWIGLDG